jgi:hypothetical protein
MARKGIGVSASRRSGARVPKTREFARARAPARTAQDVAEVEARDAVRVGAVEAEDEERLRHHGHELRELQLRHDVREGLDADASAAIVEVHCKAQRAAEVRLWGGSRCAAQRSTVRVCARLPRYSLTRCTKEMATIV